MADLVKGRKIGITGGLHSRLSAKQMLDKDTPARPVTEMPHRIVVIADFSGSMDSSSGTGTQKTKMECLKDGIQDFALRSDPTTTAIAVESFPSGFRIDLTTDNQQVMLRMYGASTLGDTPMGTGLSVGLQMHSPTRGLLISDGEATDGDASYDQARIYREREIPIDCVHIGTSSGGEERLKKIAEITGGMYLKFRDSVSFSESFHFLLPESREQIAGMLPYERAKLLGADESR